MTQQEAQITHQERAEKVFPYPNREDYELVDDYMKAVDKVKLKHIGFIAGIKEYGNPESVEIVNNKAENLLKKLEQAKHKEGIIKGCIVYADIVKELDELKEALIAAKLT